MQVTLNIQSIAVLCRPGQTDKVYIRFDGQSPFLTGENPLLEMEVMKGAGVKYVQEVFKVEPEVFLGD